MDKPLATRQVKGEMIWKRTNPGMFFYWIGLIGKLLFLCCCDIRAYIDPFCRALAFTAPSPFLLSHPSRPSNSSHPVLSRPVPLRRTPGSSRGAVVAGCRCTGCVTLDRLAARKWFSRLRNRPGAVNWCESISRQTRQANNH